jgi:hypothetical protein
VILVLYRFDVTAVFPFSRYLLRFCFPSLAIPLGPFHQIPYSLLVGLLLRFSVEFLVSSLDFVRLHNTSPSLRSSFRSFIEFSFAFPSCFLLNSFRVHCRISFVLSVEFLSCPLSNFSSFLLDLVLEIPS